MTINLLFLKRLCFVAKREFEMSIFINGKTQSMRTVCPHHFGEGNRFCIIMFLCNRQGKQRCLLPAQQGPGSQEAPKFHGSRFFEKILQPQHAESMLTPYPQKIFPRPCQTGAKQTLLRFFIPAHQSAPASSLPQINPVPNPEKSTLSDGKIHKTLVSSLEIYYTSY